MTIKEVRELLDRLEEIKPDAEVRLHVEAFQEEIPDIGFLATLEHNAWSQQELVFFHKVVLQNL